MPQDVFWQLVSELGDERFYMLALILIYIAYSPRLGYRLSMIFLMSMWLNVALKNTLQYPRPSSFMWKTEVSGYSFPSGHAQGVSTFWFRLLIECRKLWILPIAILVTSLVSYSRIYLGVHYLHDVVAGVILGLTFAITPTLIGLRFKLTNLESLLPKVISIVAIMLLLISSLIPGGYGDIPLICGYMFGLSAGYDRLKYKSLKISLCLRMILVVIAFLTAYIIKMVYVGLSLRNVVLDFIVYSIVGFIISYVIPTVGSYLLSIKPNLLR